MWLHFNYLLPSSFVCTSTFFFKLKWKQRRQTWKSRATAAASSTTATVTMTAAALTTTTTTTASASSAKFFTDVSSSSTIQAHTDAEGRNKRDLDVHLTSLTCISLSEIEKCVAPHRRQVLASFNFKVLASSLHSLVHRCRIWINSTWSTWPYIDPCLSVQDQMFIENNNVRCNFFRTVTDPPNIKVMWSSKHFRGADLSLVGRVVKVNQLMKVARCDGGSSCLNYFSQLSGSSWLMLF